MSPLANDSPLMMCDAPGPAPGVLDRDVTIRHNIEDGSNDNDLSSHPQDTPSSPPPRFPAFGNRTSSERTGSRLPQELVDVVLDFLWADVETLSDCILVSRAWHLYVIRRGLLDGHLSLTTASELTSLVRSMPAEAKRLRDVHTVDLAEASSGTTPWLHRALLALCTALPGIMDLIIREWRPARAPLCPLIFVAFSQLRTVHRLYLIDCTFSSTVQLQHLLVELLQLRILVLVGVYVPTRRNGIAHQCKLMPRLEWLWLGNSRKTRPGEDSENVAGCLAEWFVGNEAKLEAPQGFHLEIRHELLREGELASLGRPIEVLGPHIHQVSLDFVDPPTDPLDPVTNWRELKLECCTRVQILQVFRSTPALHELALLSPECTIRELQLRRRDSPYKQKTDWAATATALEGDVFAKLKKVVNARSLQSGETRELEAFVGRMHARGVEFVDRTGFPWWDS